MAMRPVGYALLPQQRDLIHGEFVEVRRVGHNARAGPSLSVILSAMSRDEENSQP
jgi:hypothetical protein